MNRLAFHNKAATLEHLHSLLLTASLLLLGLAILQVLDVRIIDTVESTRIEPFLGENRVILD